VGRFLATATGVAAVLGLLLVSSSTAQAQALANRAPPDHRVVHRSMIALRGNPSGLTYDGRLGYRLRLHENEGLALRDNFVGGGAALALTPAYVRIGPYVEVAPASFITLWSSLQYSRYFGGFGILQSFPSPRSNFSDDELERLDELPDDDPLANYSTSGLELTLGLDLQAKVGSVAVRSQSKLIRADLDLRDGDQVFYEQTTDVLMPDAGFSLVSDLDVAYLGFMAGRLVVAARYTASVPFYDSSAYLPGEPDDSDNASHRLGPIVAYTFHSRDGAAFNMPTLLLVAQWWLDHRYRAGAESSQGLPMVAIAFRFHGDLLALD
jgi:hypothetical protein